jgi:hypothetical protein
MTTPDTHRTLLVVGPQRTLEQFATYNETCARLMRTGFVILFHPAAQRDLLPALYKCDAVACADADRCEAEVLPAVTTARAFDIPVVDASTLQLLACNPAPEGI